MTFGSIARRGGGWLPLIGISSLVGALATLALPTVLGRAVDGVVADSATNRWLLLAGGLVAFGVICDLIDAFAGKACVASTTAWLRERLIRHLLGIGPSATKDRHFDVGDLVSRVSSNAVDAAHAGPSAITIGAAVVPPLGSLVLLALIDVWVAAAFVGGICLVVLVLRAFTRGTAVVFTSYQQTQGQIAARLTESLAGARTIAAAGTLARERQRVLEPLPELNAHGINTWRVLARSAAQAAVVGPLALVAVLVAGGLALAAHRITPGAYFAASQYAMIGAGLGSLTSVFGELARARAGIRRLAEVLTVDAVRYGNRRLPDGLGQLEFRQVGVRSRDRVLLDGIDVVLPGGVTTAVVGRSGSGKSILAAVAARLTDPTEGEVRLDGVRLSDIRRDVLRTAVACAFERPVLVGETVGDAIGLGRPREQTIAAARATNAHTFVSRLPEGYDTALVDAPMSGGERQRIGLARAWHAKRLLVLDDATSSLDVVTELQITQTLTASTANRPTRLIVTHRVDTAARSDLVLWLEDGRIRGFGPHRRLWEQPAYREVFA
ncbi:ABC transporter ATP-binding protein [Actinopolymorpha rutila]|uniref:ATP-binding cassette subfamily B protein n=1 Tax=Actinopolymorpha rutila TaxID=446787 RepID=A0A852ZQA1_9ACTN|nr:ABC transporter ATP-binding protein [Actinopolymorpha rutila]NYH91200.1 ATP-binding cassette subfamily B protein [Actinopolymorpha rutila]